MSIITENIIEQLKKLTLIEASELVNKIESTFDVDASSTSQTMLAAPGISNGNTLINPLTVSILGNFLDNPNNE